MTNRGHFQPSADRHRCSDHEAVPGPRVRGWGAATDAERLYAPGPSSPSVAVLLIAASVVAGLTPEAKAEHAGTA